jgi:hypothetical protein
MINKIKLLEKALLKLHPEDVHKLSVTYSFEVDSGEFTTLYDVVKDILKSAITEAYEEGVISNYSARVTGDMTRKEIYSRAKIEAKEAYNKLNKK